MTSHPATRGRRNCPLFHANVAEPRLEIAFRDRSKAHPESLPASTASSAGPGQTPLRKIDLSPSPTMRPCRSSVPLASSIPASAGCEYAARLDQPRLTPELAPEQDRGKARLPAGNSDQRPDHPAPCRQPPDRPQHQSLYALSRRLRSGSCRRHAAARHAPRPRITFSMRLSWPRSSARVCPRARSLSGSTFAAHITPAP